LKEIEIIVFCYVTVCSFVAKNKDLERPVASIFGESVLKMKAASSVEVLIPVYVTSYLRRL
jgi:hypothetical protein